MNYKFQCRHNNFVVFNSVCYIFRLYFNHLQTFITLSETKVDVTVSYAGMLLAGTPNIACGCCVKYIVYICITIFRDEPK
jgi:hypothetical protein